MRKFFGTDGIRGTSNTGVMTADIALKIGMAAGTIFSKEGQTNRVIIGKDTRLSGYLFENAITAGFLATGMDVFLLGPMPTPSIGMLAKSMRANMGVMISASHNPYQDNGLKLFGPDGHKLSDEMEVAIENAVLNPELVKLALPNKIGRAKRIDDAPGRYIEFIKNSFPKGYKLDGMKIVIDCANGAAYHLGGKIFWELGAEVIEIGVNPNGVNINEDCGSTNIEKLSSIVLDSNADLGIALDGDGDRIQMIDEKGNIIDGDTIIALIACYLKSENKLNHNKVVATHLSNLGFEHYLNSQNIELVRTQVGDRHVAAKMKELDISLGGEQSGHVIVSNYSTTGDGLVAALQILALIKKKGKKLSEIACIYTPFPQLIRNVKYNDPNLLGNKELLSSIKNIEVQLGKDSRVLIRKSGTEKLIRIMVEAQSFDIVKEALDKLEDALSTFDSK